ncbi:hypothetical protein CDL15_Pgr024233 [Punica granatum]|uniref:Uncharacterized protein n=1 Tax=Punica granatum TaxID=22663 RepID=A0A218XWH1_PUNGR|nr:hypothetical protein CDL15_Pgr024233 [Punica granatum]
MQLSRGELSIHGGLFQEGGLKAFAKGRSAGVCIRGGFIYSELGLDSYNLATQCGWHGRANHRVYGNVISIRGVHGYRVYPEPVGTYPNG